MRASLHITHDCNLRCDYCYTGEKTGTAMSYETGRDAVDFVFDLSPRSAEFTFFGGEPLLEFETMRRLITYTRSAGERRNVQPAFILITNGTLLTRDILSDLHSERVQLRLSLDGNRYAQDCSRRLRGGDSSYHVIERRFGDILEYFPDVLLLMVITPMNYRYLAEGIRELSGIGFRHFVATPAFESGWDERNLQALGEEYERVAEYYLESFRRGRDISVSFIDGKIHTHILSRLAVGHRCEMGRGEIAIAASGNIYPCLRLVGDDSGEDTCLGTIYDDPDYERWERFSLTPGEAMEGCGECVLARRCINTCGALNYAMTGDIRRPSPVVCAHEQMAIPVADRVGNTLYGERNQQFMDRFYGLRKRKDYSSC